MTDVLVPNDTIAPPELNPQHKPQQTEAMDLSSPEAIALMDKYATERTKRFRDEGASQFITAGSPGYEHFLSDNWLNSESSSADAGQTCLVEGSRCSILILGAGYGGLLSAARFIQSGVLASEIRLVDAAGGFGGAWYYNRYPGLMCDVESYIYMPLLEELGYMPKHKYAYGTELRRHAENIAEHFGLSDKALFQTRVLASSWDETAKEWITTLGSNRKGREGEEFAVSSRFVVLAGGSINYPKVPRIPGFKDFAGHVFHTSRWDYSYTGGSETCPELVNLKDKRVAVVGTGATAVQVIPQLAEYAKELYVFQRTPSAVDSRGQQETDPSEWTSKIANKKGWQRERYLNFARFLANDAPVSGENLVNDQWSKFPSYAALMGSPHAPSSLADVPAYIRNLQAMDLLRSERVRARVDSIVADKTTASALKPYYPGWCKRPCFHDGYLQSFNRSNVHLVDTDGRGIDAITPSGLVVAGTTYPVDAIVLATGYDVLLTVSPAARCHIRIAGRGGVDMDAAWDEAAGSLHGTMMAGFPNLFLLGLGQTGLTPNVNAMLNPVALNHAYILRKALERVGAAGQEVAKERGKYPFTVEPTVEAQEEYIQELVASQTAFAGMASCPPGYFNGEGDLFKIMQTGPEAQYKLARGGVMGKGYFGWVEGMEKWQADGKMEGMLVESV